MCKSRKDARELKLKKKKGKKLNTYDETKAHYCQDICLLLLLLFNIALKVLANLIRNGWVRNLIYTKKKKADIITTFCNKTFTLKKSKRIC